MARSGARPSRSTSSSSTSGSDRKRGTAPRKTTLKASAKSTGAGGRSKGTAKPATRRTGSGKAGGKGRRKGGRRRSWLRRYAWPMTQGLLVAAIWVGLAGAAMVVYFAHDLPDPVEAASVTRRPSVTVLAADGSRIAAFGDLRGASVQAREVPMLVQAVLSTEDRRFYDHFGMDVLGIARAMVVNIRAGRVVQGGSTITQQVAKNLFLTQDRTFKRKIQEVLLALWLEYSFTKDQILTLYLNRVYLGAGTHGVDAASWRYFNKPATRMDLYEAAVIAGLPKAPSRLNPLASPRRADARAREVLQNMAEAGFLSAEQARAAGEGGLAKLARGAGGTGRAGSWFADWVADQLEGYVGSPDRDLVVRTTLDPALEARAEAVLRTALDGPGREQKAGQGAVLVMDTSGAVRAMIGGPDHASSPFNRTVQARRQPGSAFKPFVYLAGLEAGLAPDSVMTDAPVTVDGWSPGNYGHSFRGDVTLADALAHSLNTVAVRVSEYAGRSNVVKVAQRMGLVAHLRPEPAVALGVFEVSLIDLVAAYAPFATGGYAVLPHGIESITDGDGRVLYKRSPSEARRVIASADAATMDAMLARVVSQGTAKAAQLPGGGARGKTGTSQSYRDAWFIGYAGPVLAGVWLGNDNGKPMEEVTGGSLPAEIWRKVMGGE